MPTACRVSPHRAGRHPPPFPAAPRTRVRETYLFILGDHRTGGERRVWVGYRLDDGLWLDISVAATKRSAFAIAGPLIKRIVGG